jgi:hypothetical protein
LLQNQEREILFGTAHKIFANLRHSQRLVDMLCNGLLVDPHRIRGRKVYIKQPLVALRVHKQEFHDEVRGSPNPLF